MKLVLKRLYNKNKKDNPLLTYELSFAVELIRKERIKDAIDYLNFLIGKYSIGKQ